MALKRPRDTRYSSHYGTFINLMHLFSSVIDVLGMLERVVMMHDVQSANAIDLLDIVHSFKFVFVLHLMRQILGITHEFSQVLQKKDQDIVNAMNLAKVTKARLQAMRDNGWETLLSDVSKFCNKHEIIVINMEDEYAARGRVRRRTEKMRNLHHYQVELFYSVIDIYSFSAFDKKKLLRLVKFYPSESSKVPLYELESQLENFIFDVHLDGNFSEISGIAGLTQKLVSTRKHVMINY